jgi:hypothetical protein
VLLVQRLAWAKQHTVPPVGADPHVAAPQHCAEVAHGWLSPRQVQVFPLQRFVQHSELEVQNPASGPRQPQVPPSAPGTHTPVQQLEVRSQACP